MTAAILLFNRIKIFFRPSWSGFFKTSLSGPKWELLKACWNLHIQTGALWSNISLKLFYLLHLAAVYCRKKLGACPHWLSVLSWREEMVWKFQSYRLHICQLNFCYRCTCSIPIFCVWSQQWTSSRKSVRFESLHVMNIFLEWWSSGRTSCSKTPCWIREIIIYSLICQSVEHQLTNILIISS